jgi:transposase
MRSPKRRWSSRPYKTVDQLAVQSRTLVGCLKETVTARAWLKGCVIAGHLGLTEEQRRELIGISQSRALPAGYVTRAKLILLLSEGVPYSEIGWRLGTSRPTIIRWKELFLREGVNGLDSNHPGQKPFKLTPGLRAKVLAATRRKPTDSSTHWSCRKQAAALGISKDLVQRVWKEAGVRPHRLERYMASTDPDFESKVADIIGLYL